MAAVEKVVQAERFELVDSQGNVRARLGAGADGSPSLHLLDSNGAPRISLWVRSEPRMLTDEGPGLELCGENAVARARISVRSDGAPAVRLLDEQGIERAVLALKPDGAPSLHLFNKGGQVRAMLDVLPEPDESGEHGALTVSGKSGSHTLKPRAKAR